MLGVEQPIERLALPLQLDRQSRLQRRGHRLEQAHGRGGCTPTLKPRDRGGGRAAPRTQDPLRPALPTAEGSDLETEADRVHPAHGADPRFTGGHREGAVSGEDR